MKKFLKIMLCIMGSLLAVIVVFWCCISYAVNYKKTTCDTSVSPNKKYELTLQAVGEPDWLFGSASGRLILMEGKDKISQTDFELHNDGGSITSNCWKVTWYTVTVLKFTRELKELGVGIFFEEQNINTLSGDGEMMLAVLASFAQEESRSMSENNKWSIRKKFERGEVMITTSRFLGYDKNEYGDLIVNRKEAQIVSLTFDLYLLNVGSSRIGELLDYLGVKTVTGTTWESGTINGMLCNEKYKGDFHLQKYYTPENKRNHTRKNNGEVQSYYISENHEPIVSPEVWEKVQEVREQRKRDRNIGQDSTMKFQNRYPLSGMLICPYCEKTLRRRQVYKKKIQWLCSTYIEKGVKACKGIRIDDAELQGLNITEQTVIEEVVKNGKKHYCYTSKADFDCGISNSAVSAEIEDGSVLPSVNRPRRTVIKL